MLDDFKGCKWPVELGLGLLRIAATSRISGKGTAFNEAAVFPLRKANFWVFSICATPSFNEAAVFPLRKEVRNKLERLAKKASMRPQCFHCGKPRNNQPRGSQYYCFNEAAVFPLRKDS